MGGRLRVFVPLAIALVLSSCVGPIKGKPPGPWHEAYEPLNDPAAEKFLFESLEKATIQFGQPAIPVNQVLLRRSRKTKAARNYRIGEDFSLTKCIDSTNGIFVVYIGVDPDHKNYFPLLGHECAHLLNAHITDWYMEGLATAFSERICSEAGLEWGDWKRHFSRSRREPYALSYRMMKDLQAAFPDAYPALIQFAVQNGHDPQWLRIDIDAWLKTLSPALREEALDIIEPNVAVLRKRTSKQYGFTVPGELE